MVSTFHRGFQCWGHIPYLFCIHPYLVSRAHFLVRLGDCHSCTYMNNKFCAVLHLHCRNRGSCWGGAAWPYVSVSTGPKTGVQNGVQKWDTLGARTVRAPGGLHFWTPFWPPPGGHFSIMHQATVCSDTEPKWHGLATHDPSTSRPTRACGEHLRHLRITHMGTRSSIVHYM